MATKTNTKPIQIRIRIADADTGVLDDLGGPVMSRTDVASVILHAAIEAIRKNGGVVHFPPQFTVEEIFPARGSTLNDAPPAKGKR